MTNAWSIARTGERPSRSVLLVSLALNLFILGVGGALAVRHFMPGGSTTPPEPARSAAARIDRLAATLPGADAEILRAEFRARETSVEAANTKYRAAQDRIRSALRAEPFKADAMRAAMAETRTARYALSVALEDVIVSAAAKMSSEGRHRFAEWTPPQQTGTAASR
jgi:uncharacterized membrane protein